MYMVEQRMDCNLGLALKLVLQQIPSATWSSLRSIEVLTLYLVIHKQKNMMRTTPCCLDVSH